MTVAFKRGGSGCERSFACNGLDGIANRVLCNAVPFLGISKLSIVRI